MMLHHRFVRMGAESEKPVLAAIEYFPNEFGRGARG